MPTAHCVSTGSGIIRSVDAGFCRLMGRPRDDLIGLSYQAITVDEDIPKSVRMLKGLPEQAGPMRLRKRYRRPDGSVVEADLLVSRLEEGDQLVATLSWREGPSTGASPLRMWKAALHARHLYACRMEELGEELFGDFVGAILIEAYLSEAEGRLLTVDELAVSIGLRVDGVARWVKALRQRDLLQAAEPDERMVQLAHAGLTKVERLLTAGLTPIDRAGTSRRASG